MFPPHLPPPSSSIAQHQAMLRLKIIITAVIFGLLAGLAGAAIMIGWLWPGASAPPRQGVATAARTSGASTLPPDVVSLVNHEMLAIHPGVRSDGAIRFLDSAEATGQAIVLSSDGWAVFHASSMSAASAGRLVLLSSSGELFRLTHPVFDSAAGFGYAKIIPAGPTSTFAPNLSAVRPITFAPVMPAPSEAFVLAGGAWQSVAIVAHANSLMPTPHLDSAPAWGYELGRSFNPGAPVVDASGRLVGVTVSKNLVMPGVFINDMWPRVLGIGKATYTSLGLTGWFDEEKPILVAGKRQRGFVVTGINKRSGALRRGDIITAVNGEPVRSEMWLGALGRASEVNLTVLRGSETIELTVPVIQL